MNKNNPQVLESGGKNVAGAAPPQVASPKGNKEPDSLLDVFKSEGLEENSVSALSKELGDVSIYSLLEQTKQVADAIKLRH
jgi:hypothetical protein